MSEIESLDRIPELIKSEGLEVAVVSYGGCASNTLVRCLESNGFKCRTDIWGKLLCHCPKPVDSDIPFIYLYRNIQDAFISMKRRGTGIWDLNQMKLANNYKVEISDENMINLMKAQYHNWTSIKASNILVVSYEELFTPAGKLKIEGFLGRSILNYPKNTRKHNLSI